MKMNATKPRLSVAHKGKKMNETKPVGKRATRDALFDIAKRNRGKLRPCDIVEAARLKSSPLHRYFQWEDTDAAHKWRLHQAQKLIRTISLKITKPSRDKKTVEVKYIRQFYSRPSQRTEKGGYETIADIVSDKDKRKELVDRILLELKSYRTRYENFVELQGIWKEVDRALEEYKANQKKAA